jgi:hypothetical protein
VDERDHLSTLFGIYMLLLEWTAVAHGVTGLRRHFLWWTPRSSGGMAGQHRALSEVAHATGANPLRRALRQLQRLQGATSATHTSHTTLLIGPALR